MMLKYYDRNNHRLVFLGQKSDSDYWNAHWLLHSNDDIVLNVKKNTESKFIIEHTRRYLSNGSAILEGGCGWGQNVYTLHQNGFKAYGVDYTYDNILKINSVLPELMITHGDIRQLDFDDGSFHGYWSWGVIEHYMDGYDSIRTEMFRVIQNHGYLFLTVPTMSLLREIKAYLGLYSELHDTELKQEDFYQYAFSHNSVIDNFTNNGFILVKQLNFSGIKGLKDEIKIIQSPMQKIFISKKQLFTVRLLRKCIDTAVRRWAGHMTLFVFRKETKT